jgi:hypothetical protein
VARSASVVAATVPVTLAVAEPVVVGQVDEVLQPLVLVVPADVFAVLAVPAGVEEPAAVVVGGWSAGGWLASEEQSHGELPLGDDVVEPLVVGSADVDVPPVRLVVVVAVEVVSGGDVVDVAGGWVDELGAAFVVEDALGVGEPADPLLGEVVCVVGEAVGMAPVVPAER